MYPASYCIISSSICHIRHPSSTAQSHGGWSKVLRLAACLGTACKSCIFVCFTDIKLGSSTDLGVTLVHKDVLGPLEIFSSNCLNCPLIIIPVPKHSLAPRSDPLQITIFCDRVCLILSGFVCVKKLTVLYLETGDDTLQD